MTPSLRNLREEFRPMFALALPVVVAELGWMVMGMVDTLMVGRLSPEAIGAVGIGSAVFMAVGIFAMGVLLGLDTLVSQAFGARRLEECHRWLYHGVALACLLTLPVTGGLFLLSASLRSWGLDPGVLALAEPYLDVVTWSTLPLLLYFAFRRYLQGIGVVRPVMFALMTANIANVAVNWVLIYGNLGAPALGVVGAAWATVISRVVMAAFLLAAILRHERERHPRLADTPIRIEAAWMGRLVRLGFPAALQLTLEVGVFAAASALAGRFEPAALAAHQIAINLAGFTFMVPLGIASAGAVRVGHAIGRGDGTAAVRAGWTALLFGGLFMSAAAVVFLVLPRPLLLAFTSSPAVIEIGVVLLALAAVFQLFDGLQVVATGALRGLGDTRTPMLCNLAAHWVLGLPLGYALAFHWGLGVPGLWVGLSAGLIMCGVILLGVWRRRARTVLPLLSGSAGGVMPEQHDRPRPHGDPLEREVVEPNPAQRQSDAPDDVVANERPAGGREESDREEGRGSSANGLPAADGGEQRRKQYEGGAELVSKLD
jgi:multidrug resistance protein, MATE family